MDGITSTQQGYYHCEFDSGLRGPIDLDTARAQQFYAGIESPLLTPSANDPAHSRLTNWTASGSGTVATSIYHDQAWAEWLHEIKAQYSADGGTTWQDVSYVWTNESIGAHQLTQDRSWTVTFNRAGTSWPAGVYRICARPYYETPHYQGYGPVDCGTPVTLQ